MRSEKRRRFKGSFKAAVALEAIRELRPINEIASEHGLHPTQVTTWKRQTLEALPRAFEDGRAGRGRDGEELMAQLYQQIGQFKVELDWLKKKSGLQS